MCEKNYETSELKELKDVLQTFTEFVWEMEEYLPEFYHFFDAMRQNIEIFLRVGEEDEEQIHEILPAERDEIPQYVFLGYAHPAHALPDVDKQTVEELAAQRVIYESDH